MSSEWCRVMAHLVAGLLFVVSTGGVDGTPQGYGSYENYNHGAGYNVIAEQPLVKEVVDYYAKPKYSFGYEVEDYYNQLSHGRWEIRDGDVVQGQYRVLLPDGRVQIVSYIADKGGYRPHIQYIGKGVHPPPPPAYANVKVPHQLLEPVVASPAVLPAAYPSYAVANNAVRRAPIPIYAALPKAAPVGPALIPHGPDYGHSYGGDFGYGESILTPARISRKRALLYDRTLFRRDIPQPSTTPRK